MPAREVARAEYLTRVPIPDDKREIAFKAIHAVCTETPECFEYELTGGCRSRDSVVESPAQIIQVVERPIYRDDEIIVEGEPGAVLGRKKWSACRLRHSKGDTGLQVDGRPVSGATTGTRQCTPELPLTRQARSCLQNSEYRRHAIISSAGAMRLAT